MANAIVKIGKRAKAMYNKSGNKRTYIECVKAASKEYNAGKLGTATTVGAARKKKKPYQTGTSHKAFDSMRSARAPGKRKSASGKTYYERRKNRSDMPGKLTGTQQNDVVLRNLTQENMNLRHANARLEGYKDMLLQGAGKDRSKRNDIKKSMKRERLYIATIKKQISMLKALLR